MDIFWSVVSVVCMLAGLIGCILPVIPGPILGYAGMLAAYACGYSSLSVTALCVWGAATLLVTVVDYILPARMAKFFGGSRSGIIGATAGMIIGVIFFNIPGVILGPFVGAVTGELINDSSNIGRALQVGFGSFLSFVMSTGMKLVLVVCMMYIVFRDMWHAVAG